MAAANRSFILTPTPASKADFVGFWARIYGPESDDEAYEQAIRSDPHTSKTIKALFEWKNSGPLSAKKAASVNRNYIERASEVQQLGRDVNADAFLRHFRNGGAIWRIFWLHCCHPDRFPIYDQHTHRAMVYVLDGKIEELNDFNDRRKVSLYLTGYLPFHTAFSALKQRDVDRALFAFGKFLKRPRISLPALTEQAGDECFIDSTN